MHWVLSTLNSLKNNWIFEDFPRFVIVNTWRTK